jgi:hypothetical protein
LSLEESTSIVRPTLRQRGNAYLEHERAGKPPVLHFDYEIVVDARKFERPVNYALLRITPPKGVIIDPKRRPYVVIDPRAGHGPGIGGFKDDSQVGVALRDGHPVYFVIFFPEPERGPSRWHSSFPALSPAPLPASIQDRIGLEASARARPGRSRARRSHSAGSARIAG